MLAATDRLEFVPPPAPGLVRALALAVLAHAFLLAALTWGVHWKREAATLSVEAELWSALPQEAAPQALEVPLPVAPEPVPPPVPVAEPAPVPVEPAKVDIAIEQEKLRLKKLKEKELIEKKRLQEKEKEKQQQERQAAEEKKKVELEKQRKQALLAKQEAQKIEAQRSDNLKRIAGLAGASGAPDAKGTALRSSGPSGSYAGRISARIKPNIVFTEEIAGNPVADVEVRSAPNGTILSRKLIKSSGLKAWDDAVLKAIDKTEKLPPDTDGQVPASMIIGFRPKD
ncbi:MAG: energy transducer TonB [Comamonadaceae bacterium]